MAKKPSSTCIDPACDGILTANNSIEVCQCPRMSWFDFPSLQIGHCFMLGDRYSKVFDLHFKDGNSEKRLFGFLFPKIDFLLGLLLYECIDQHVIDSLIEAF